MRETKTMIMFWGDYLSNFYECYITFNGYLFQSSEQLFMYLKAEFFHDSEISKKILQSKKPYEAKKLGRLVKNFDESRWNEVREESMFIALKEKFTQNKELKNLLLSTGDKILVEGSPKDNIWGVGIHYNEKDCENPKKWKGLNLLGKTLMRIREGLHKDTFITSNSEEIRIISLFGLKSGITDRYSDIKSGFEFHGLYTDIMKKFDINPEKLNQ